MMKQKTFMKVAIASAIILGIMAIIRKVKISMFKEMDFKMKALGLPILAFVVAQFLVKKEEYSQPITIGAIIAFVSGILEVTGSEKFKQEDLGLAGDNSLMTTEFNSLEELNDYITANMPQGQSQTVGGNYVEVIPQLESEERGTIEELFGEMAGSHSMIVE